MVNRSAIGKAIETILRQGTEGYTIVRNEKRNEDPNLAAQGKGWIGIYRGRASFKKGFTGPSPWVIEIEQSVEIQVASMQDGTDLEGRLESAVNEVVDILSMPTNRTLNNTVLTITGFDLEDEINTGVESYHQSCIITIKAEART